MVAVFTIKFDTETEEFSIVNVSTGEIKKQKVISENDESNEPELILSQNRYVLNRAAIELIGAKPGDKIDIKFDTNGVPVIALSSAFGTPDTGNVLTKIGSVRYSGTNQKKLAEYGNKFSIEIHPQNEGVFVLKNDLTPVVSEEVHEKSSVDILGNDNDDFDALLDDLVEEEQQEDILEEEEEEEHNLHALDFTL